MARSDLADPETVTVHVPIGWKKRGERKRIIAPVSSVSAPPPRRVDDALVKALARAHRLRRLLESGAYESITALATAEKIDKSHLCKILRLTTLAPAIIKMILDGRQPEALDFRRRLLKPFPAEWQRQLDTLSETRSTR
jgi:hypothetical protein